MVTVPEKISILALVAAECIAERELVCPAHVAKAVRCTKEHAYLLLRRAQRDRLVVRAGRNPHHAKFRIQWDDRKWRLCG